VTAPAPSAGSARRPGPAGARPGEPFDLLALFSVLWAAATLFHLFRPSVPLALLRLDPESAANLALCLLAVALLLRPRSTGLLVALALAQLVEFALSMPVISNHYVIAAFLNLAICACFLALRVRRGPVGAPRQEFFAGWSPVGRHLLLLTYFLAVFHKLNADWFDPRVSCAVALTDSLLAPLGLDFPSLDPLVIYGTLAVEGAAMVLLCMPRWKLLGFAIGMPLHIAIGLVPYSWYPNFSSLSFALYALFLPEGLPARLEALVREHPLLLRIPRRLSLRLAPSLFLAGALIAAGTHLLRVFEDPFAPQDFAVEKRVMHAVLVALWALYSLPIYALFLLLQRGKPFPASRGYWWPRPRALAALSSVFLLNGFAPYLGLQTEGTMSMFSNLHTEGGVTNHLILDPPPYLFDYQRKVATILASSDQRLRRLADDGLGMVELALWRHLREHPEASLGYRLDGDVQRLARAADALAAHPQPWLTRKLLAFKDVDFRRPKACSH